MVIGNERSAGRWHATLASITVAGVMLCKIGRWRCRPYTCRGDWIKHKFLDPMSLSVQVQASDTFV